MQPKIESTTYIFTKTQSSITSFSKLAGLSFLVFILIIVPFIGIQTKHSYAQVSYDWANGLGNTGYDLGNALIVDEDNNSFIVGNFEGTADFDPGAGTSNLTSTGSSDVFILKLNSDGEFVWAKSVGGTGGDSSAGIALDSSGSLLLTGYFAGTADFDPGAGTSNLTSAGSVDTFILKLDSSGTFVWVKKVGGTGSDAGQGLDLDSSDNIYIATRFTNTVDYDPGAGTSNLTSGGGQDTAFLKLDSSGNFVWAKQIGGAGYQVMYELDVDSSGNVYGTGEFDGTADFDPGAGTSNLTSAGSSDVPIVKLDSSGNFVWARQFGSVSFEYAKDITVDDDGNVHTTGIYYDTIDFDPGVGISNLTPIGDADSFVSKLDSSGNFVWAKSFGGIDDDEVQAITLDEDGNVYTTGYFYQTVDFDPGAATTNLTSGGQADSYVSALNSSGDFLFVRHFSGTGWGSAYDISIGADNSVFTTGEFETTVDFDPGAGTSNLTSGGQADVFISRLSPVSAPTISTTSASLVNTSGALLTSNITATGGEDSTERGFQYGTSLSYGSEVSESGTFSTGSYSLELTGLACGTTYYARSYAENSGGTGTGTGTSFTTTQCSSSGSGGSSSRSGNKPEDPIEYCPGQTDPITCNIPVPVTDPIPSSSGSAVETFQRNLGFGSIGEDVRRLQEFLNQHNFLLSSSGNGSPGKETTYYGPRTSRAVKKFQEYYKDQILTPLSLNNGTWYFGEKTRMFINSLVKN